MTVERRVVDRGGDRRIRQVCRILGESCPADRKQRSRRGEIAWGSSRRLELRSRARRWSDVSPDLVN